MAGVDPPSWLSWLAMPAAVRASVQNALLESVLLETSQESLSAKCEQKDQVKAFVVLQALALSDTRPVIASFTGQSLQASACIQCLHLSLVSRQVQDPAMGSHVAAV